MRALLTLATAALLLAACTPVEPTSARTPTGAGSSGGGAASSTSAEPLVPIAGECAYSSAGIPDTAMVRDVLHTGTGVTENCIDQRAADAYGEYLPDPCGRGLGIRTSSIVARRAIEVVFDDDPSTADAQPSVYRHTVTAYNSGDAASAYMSSVRAAVRECPVRELANETWAYAIVSSTAQRLDLSVRRTTRTFSISIARSDARVSVLVDAGWEGVPSRESAVDALVKAAAQQLEHWG